MAETIDEADRDLQSWMALGVRARYEKAVAGEIAARARESFLPLIPLGRPGSGVTVPLFPGYVLGRINIRDAVEWMATSPNVTHVVMADRAGDRVVEREVTALKAVLGSGLAVSVWPYADSGHDVRVRHVGFPGLEGELVFADGGAKLVVSCVLLQRSIAIDARLEWVDIAFPSPASVQPPPELHTLFQRFESTEDFSIG